MYAVVGSGSRSMSDSWICWNPRIDDPSNIRPSLKTDGPKFDAGNVKCCITPGRSQNLTSTNCTPSSLINFSTSWGLLNSPPPEQKADPRGKGAGGGRLGVLPPP